MTVKCFKVGQTVVIAGDGGAARASRKGRTEAVVTKVGRKYVTAVPVGGGYETKYREPESERCGYLVEQTEIGSPRLLLPSIHAADAYYETEELRLWLVKAAGWDGVHRYSLEQLREVKRILERVRPENGPLTLFELECMVGERFHAPASVPPHLVSTRDSPSAMLSHSLPAASVYALNVGQI